ncbi:MAG: TonB-dependent siderophore receptor [Cyanobacteria bacterium P01_A01_bin.116]
MPPSALANLTEPLPTTLKERADETPIRGSSSDDFSELAQSEAAEITAEITDVQIVPTPTGLNISLVTDGDLIVGDSQSVGNALVTELPNAILTLVDSAAAEQFEPTEGIALVQIESLPTGGVRLTITGSDAPPTVEAESSQGNDQALVFTVIPNVSSGTASSEPIRLLVTGEQDNDSFYEPRSSVATRTDTPILDVPQSVQVIPREVIESQQSVRLGEVLRNLSGAVSGGQDLGRGETFGLRGFQNVPVLRSGFRQFESGGIATDTANIDRVEVLRGPSSILFGDIRPGGVINVVTKKPTKEPFYNSQLQGGSQGLIRPSIDISGPLTEDERLLYRLNAVYQSGGDFQEVDTEISRFFIAPVLTYKISDRTDLTLELEYLNDKRAPFFGIPALGEGVANIPLDQIANEPDDISEEEYWNIGYDLEHRFNDQWRVRNGFRYTNQSALLEVAFPFELDEDTGELFRFWAAQPQASQSYTFQTSLIGEFTTGNIEHELLIGLDLNRAQGNFNAKTRLDPETPLLLDIFNPIYGQASRPDFNTLPLFSDQFNETNRLGIFVQDQVELLDNFTVLAGLRFDDIEQILTINPNDFDPTSSEATQSESSLTPRVGLVYKPAENVSLYTSYSQVFGPSEAETTTFDGDLLEFESGEGFEVGVKTELLDSNLAASLSYFNITRRNVATEDPENPFFFIATGAQRSQGVELDVSGELLPGWNVLASYAYIDAEISEDTTFEVGNGLPSAPTNSANLWTTYQIQSGALEGLNFGLGFNFVGEREGDLANSFTLDDYFLVNAAVGYEQDNWQAALNFRNLFDVGYIADTSSPVRIRGNDPGEPFTVVGTVSVTF